jgi:hypothetical protein
MPEWQGAGVGLCFSTICEMQAQGSSDARLAGRKTTTAKDREAEKLIQKVRR